MNVKFRIITRVSSILNDDEETYGCQHLFDNKDSTAWYSNDGGNQYIDVKFLKEVKIKEILLSSQGGFCPKVIFYKNIMVRQAYDGTEVKSTAFTLENTNKMQVN